MTLLFGLVFTTTSVVELLWPGSINVHNDEIKVGPQDGSAYYDVLGEFLVVGIVALLIFRWLHLRVRRIMASELGLLIMSNPVEGITWSEVFFSREKAEWILLFN